MARFVTARDLDGDGVLYVVDRAAGSSGRRVEALIGVYEEFGVRPPRYGDAGDVRRAARELSASAERSGGG